MRDRPGNELREKQLEQDVGSKRERGNLTSIDVRQECDLLKCVEANSKRQQRSPCPRLRRCKPSRIFEVGKNHQISSDCSAKYRPGALLQQLTRCEKIDAYRKHGNQRAGVVCSSYRPVFAVGFAIDIKKDQRSRASDPWQEPPQAKHLENCDDGRQWDHVQQQEIELEK